MPTLGSSICISFGSTEGRRVYEVRRRLAMLGSQVKESSRPRNDCGGPHYASGKRNSSHMITECYEALRSTLWHDLAR
ncbi:hypothetical protein BDR06DRAFT_949837 [Suillus hirtellus]|nr:hypothetical protein BDR06DRAFT_949837 [Suillus hirtellus]